MNFILKSRVIIIVLAILISLPIGLNIKNIRRDAGISALLPEDDPEYIFAGQVVDTFGSFDQLLIGVTARENIYTEEGLRLINELTEFLKNLEYIEEDDVLSLTTVQDMAGRDLL